MMTDSVIAGTELKLTARIEPDGSLTIEWDKLPGKFLFCEGYAAILRAGSGELAGMVELQRIAVDAECVSSGHVEPLLS